MGSKIGFLGNLAPFSQRLCDLCCIFDAIDGALILRYYWGIKLNELMKYTAQCDGYVVRPLGNSYITFIANYYNNKKL